VERRDFTTRRDAAEYLAPRLEPLGASRIIGNYPLWSWLGMFYFDAVVRKNPDGTPRIGRDPDIAYVIDPAPGAQAGRGETRRYAHRLMLAYEIYTQHGENAWYDRFKSA
jgi:hypothetical protein